MVVLRLREVVVSGKVESWLLAGFEVEPPRDGGELGHIPLPDGNVVSIIKEEPNLLTGPRSAHAIRALRFEGLAVAVTVMGMQVLPARQHPTGPRTRPHPNGVFGIDHVVLAAGAASSCKQLVAAWESETGTTANLVRPQGERQQAFFKVGPSCSLEMIDYPSFAPKEDCPTSNAALWGMTMLSYDIYVTKDYFGRRGCSEIRRALQQKVSAGVQGPRQIATIRHKVYGIFGCHLAVISPRFPPPNDLKIPSNH